MSQPIKIENESEDQRKVLTELYQSWEHAPSGTGQGFVVQMRDYLQANGFIVGRFQTCCGAWINQVTSWVGWYINKWNAEQ